MPSRTPARTEATVAARTRADLQRFHLALLPLVAGATGAGMVADTLAGGLAVFAGVAVAATLLVRAVRSGRPG